MNNKISLAMPTYNGGKYLREQLDSIYAQTLLPNEVIVVDDCSTDDTIEILEEYRVKYGLKYYRNEHNLGYNKNFEKAITLCSGDYIALSDQDDIWLPTKIEKCFNVLKVIDTSIPSLVSCVSSTNKEILVNEQQDCCRIIGTWKHNLSIYNSQGCTLMFNRKLMEYIIPFPNGIIYDAYIGFVASLIGNRYYLGEKLMYYRIHNNNSLVRKSSTRWERLKKNLLQVIPCWFKLDRYKNLHIVKDKYKELIIKEKAVYLDMILELYEVNNFKRLLLFNKIPEISLSQKIKTSSFLLLKMIFNIENKY